MAYKKKYVVISVPVTIEHNNKLYEIANTYNPKITKTLLARKLLEEAIDKINIGDNNENN